MDLNFRPHSSMGAVNKGQRKALAH